MRTRFLNTDYFTTTLSSSAIGSISFLNLPVPNLSLPRLSTCKDDILRLDSVLDVSFEIEKLPIHSAFSKFFSEVIPQVIDVDYHDFEDLCLPIRKGCDSERESDILHEEKEEKSERTFGSKALENGFPKKDGEIAVDQKNTHNFEAIQFETPELDVFLENVCLSHKEEIWIASEVPEIDNDLDMLKPGLAMQYHSEVQESVYSVEDVALDYHMEKRTYNLEDVGSLSDQRLFQCMFPLLEVDETSLGTLTSLSIEDGLLSFLEKPEHQNWTQIGNLLSSSKEILGSVEYDNLGFLLDYSLSKQCLEFEMASMNMFHEMDYVSMVETSQLKEDSEFHQEMAGCECFLSMSLVIFEEFEMTDVDSSKLFEAFFTTKTAIEPVTCDWMFREDMNFKNFIELIITHELAPIDDSFKSLPAPVFSDYEKRRPAYAVLKEKLAELKPQPLSASDGIYLDWHLLEGDKCNCKIICCHQKMLKDVDSHIIDFDRVSSDDEKFVYDFIFSDDASSKRNVEGCEESLNIDFVGISTLAGQPMGVSSDKLIYTSPKPGNQEQSGEKNARRASLLFKSMSEFNDLDFFLNPRKAMTGQNGESAVKDYLKSGEAADGVEASGIPPSVPCSKSPMQSEQIQQRMLSSPADTVIIVNTQNFDKEMIVSRRSTYQRILAMEKEGVQVVERDSILPVDIIICSATCLLWYDCGNIGKKATTLHEASSCLPLWVENIAANVLTLLSFTFSSCILVFEGETNFICTVMESSDGLYAAAASLGIDLQLFCSYSSELTDEIILSCIRYSIKLTSRLYPKMPESETLAESFLTKFPSVNPLTAHAMLSSIGMLIEFLECSHEHRILAVRKYYVTDESINLFSTLCKYGELEDSKSIMTDCSSSISSGADSDKCQLIVDSERKRQKCIYDPCMIDPLVDDFLHFVPLNQFTNGISNPTTVSKPYDSWKDHEIFHEYEKPSSSLNDLFGEKQELNFDMMMKPSSVSTARDVQVLECPQILKEINNPNFSLKDGLLTRNQRSEIAMMTDLNWRDTSESSNLQEDFIGEIIDVTSCPVSGKEFLSASKSLSLSPSVREMEKNSPRKSKFARKLSFGKSNHRTFPTAAEINSGADMLSSGKGLRQNLQGTNDHPGIEYNNDKMILEHRKNLLDQVLGRRFASSEEVPLQEEISHYGGTPLSNAIRSANPQPGSPWTIEFLNRIREKSRLRQQSLPCDTAAPRFGISGNISKVTKRRSPSILEFFKYHGGNTPGKLPEQKKQKRSIQPSRSSRNKIPSTSFLPTWTPIDKRAGQTLSFAVSESGSQTKLVWSDGSAQGMRKRFPNQ